MTDPSVQTRMNMLTQHLYHTSFDLNVSSNGMPWLLRFQVQVHPTKTHCDAHIFNLSLPFNPLFVKAAVVHAGTPPLTVAAVIRSSPPEARARRPAIPALLPPASGRQRPACSFIDPPNFIESSIDLLTTKKSREH